MPESTDSSRSQSHSRVRLPAGLLVAALVCQASTAAATVLWRGGFENGTRSEFARYHAVESDPPRIDVVQKPVADGWNTEGDLAAKVLLRTGDDARKLDPTTGSQVGSHDYNERTELNIPTDVMGHTYFREGDDVWISWQAMFPSEGWWGVDPSGDGTVFFQIHHVKIPEDYSGSPPLMMTADNDTIRLVQCLAFLCPEDTTRLAEPLVYDHWYTFVMHTKHSSDPSEGVLQLWIDGELKVDERTALLFGSDFGNYLLTGQYRRPGTERDATYFIDNYKIATTREEVLPPPPTTPEPTEPTDPEPTEPTEPSTPSDPAAPTEPTEPSNPSDPLVPGDGSGTPVFANRQGGCAHAGKALLMLLGLVGLFRARRR